MGFSSSVLLEGIIKSERPLSPREIRRLKDKWRQATRGGRILILDGSFSFDTASSAPSVPQRIRWAPPTPLPWILRSDPIVRLVVMAGYFAAITVLLRLIGFLY